MNKKFTILSPKGFSLTAKGKYLPTDEEIEESARTMFGILVGNLHGSVTNRVMELYNLWDKYTDDDDTPISNFGAENFLKALDAGEVKDYGNSN